MSFLSAVRRFIIENLDDPCTIYVADMPSPAQLPCIRLSDGGSRQLNTKVGDFFITSVLIDVFTSHDMTTNIQGFDTVVDITTDIQKLFDLWTPTRMKSGEELYDVDYVEYSTAPVFVSASGKYMQKQVLISATYTVI